METELHTLVTTPETQVQVNGDIIDFVDRLDFLDIQILRKFYMTGKHYPFDTQPYCFPVLFKEMKDGRQLKVGLEALRKRLAALIGCGFLEKIEHSNPAGYSPIDGKKELVKAVITRFFLVNGLTKFL
ncbi:hypothetical protein EPN87_01975 [archaeon]|nr:MAG: hypothetical protein EPN87_01975 [archaeon]